MKTAVLSDIHGNYHAFKSCIDYALEAGCDSFFLLGDYLGEFAYPERTMELLYNLRGKYPCRFIRGNKENYWLLKNENDSTALVSAPKNPISATETAISATETPINDTSMQQSKLKESKLKESKVKCVDGDALTYGTHNNIHLTAEQYDELCRDYGKAVIDDYIERCGDYVANSGKKPYSNHYQTLLNWLTKDGVEKQKQHSYDVDKILAHAKANVPKL